MLAHHRYFHVHTMLPFIDFTLLALPSAADTTKMYEKTYAAGKPKCFASGAAAPDACAGPGGSVKDPLISRPSAFDKITKPIPVVTAPPPPAKEKKKEEKPAA